MAITAKSAKRRNQQLRLSSCRRPRSGSSRVPNSNPEPYEVTSKTGNTFTIDPNLNCQLQIVDDLSDGAYDGAQVLRLYI